MINGKDMAKEPRMTNLKQELTELAEFYERHAQYEKDNARKCSTFSARQAYLKAANYNTTKAAAIREALEVVGKHTG